VIKLFYHYLLLLSPSLKKDYSNIEENYGCSRNPLQSHSVNISKSQVYTQIARKGATYKKYQQLCGARQEELNILWLKVTKELDYFKAPP